VVAAVALVAAFSPHGISDPRSITYTAALGSEQALAEPAAWLRDNVEPNDVLYPYSSVFLAALPEAGDAHALPRGQSQSLLAALDWVDYPTGDLYVGVPVGGGDFSAWTIVRVEGPLADRTAVLGEIRHALAGARSSVEEPAPALAAWFELNETVLCESLSALGSECGSE
jgi:hypothetical protein